MNQFLPPSCSWKKYYMYTSCLFGLSIPFSIISSLCRLPEDIWLVDLDANKISGPKSVERDSCDFIPALPEPECSVLRNHLKQVRSAFVFHVKWQRENVILSSFFVSHLITNCEKQECVQKSWTNPFPFNSLCKFSQCVSYFLRERICTMPWNDMIHFVIFLTFCITRILALTFLYSSQQNTTVWSTHNPHPSLTPLLSPTFTKQCLTLTDSFL